MCGRGDERGRENITIHIAVIHQHARCRHGEQRIFQRRVTVRLRDRGGVGRRGDRDGHGRGRGVGEPIAGTIAERIRADVVVRRRVTETAVGIQCERAVRGRSHQHRRERITIHIAVVGEKARRRDTERRVLERRIAVGLRDRRGVGRCGDRDGHGRGRGIGEAVVGAVAKGIRADVVVRWCVIEAAAGIERERAVRGRNDERRRQCIAIPVAVVGENTWHHDTEHRVPEHGVAVRHRDRRGVRGRRSVDRDGDGGPRREGRVVAGAVLERIDAGEVRGRGVDETPVEDHDDRAMCWINHHGRGQWIAVGVRIVRQHSGTGQHGERRVFGSGVIVRQRRRRGVQVGRVVDVNRHGRGSRLR